MTTYDNDEDDPIKFNNIDLKTLIEILRFYIALPNTMSKSKGFIDLILIPPRQNKVSAKNHGKG